MNKAKKLQKELDDKCYECGCVSTIVGAGQMSLAITTSFKLYDICKISYEKSEDGSKECACGKGDLNHFFTVKGIHNYKSLGSNCVQAIPCFELRMRRLLERCGDTNAWMNEGVDSLVDNIRELES